MIFTLLSSISPRNLVSDLRVETGVASGEYFGTA